MRNDTNQFPLLTSSLAPRYAEASYQELLGIVEAVYGEGATPESVEGLFGDIGRAFGSAGQSIGHFVQQAAPMVARAVPNIIQGASSGAAFGPWGALAGAVAGGASGIMQQSSDPTVRGIGGAIHQVGSLASSIRGGGMGGGLGSLGSIGTGGQGRAPGAAGMLASIFGGNAGATGGSGAPASGGGAANGLMGLLSRPETLQGLLSATMGNFGNQTLQIGGQQVPVHTLMSALSTLAGRAASEAAECAENAEATPEFALSAGEALGINPESSEGRTDALLTLLALTPSIWASTRSASPPLTVNVTQPENPWGLPLATAVPTGTATIEAWPEWPVWPENEWAETEWNQEADYA
jgi:hypothetical protein